MPSCMLILNFIYIPGPTYTVIRTAVLTEHKIKWDILLHIDTT